MGISSFDNGYATKAENQSISGELQVGIYFLEVQSNSDFNTTYTLTFA